MIRPIHLATLAALCLACATLPSFAGKGTDNDLQDKLRTITLSKLSFEDATVRDVFAFIRQEARRLDLEDQGINVMLQCKPEALEQKVTLEFDRIPLGEAIRYVCMGSGLKFKVEKHAVVVGDSSAQWDTMELRAYHIDAGVLRTGHSKGKGKLGE